MPREHELSELCDLLVKYKLKRLRFGNAEIEAFAVSALPQDDKPESEAVMVSPVNIRQLRGL